MAVIQPLDAPDEPGHLQAIMQVRKQHMLPEIHFGPSSPAAVIANPPSDTETRAYVANLLPKLPVQDPHFLVLYESFQPPLYYLTAGFVAQAMPPEPKAALYIGRLVAALLGAATVYFCWLATREFAPEAPLLPGALLLTGGLYVLAARRSLRVVAVGLLFLALAALNALGLVTVRRAGIAIGGVRQALRS